ncbi:MAG: glutamate formimidoyltransferase [Gemmatimonadaceae bacterium]
MKLVECVPNFSEGRDTAVIAAIRERIAAVPGVSILHVTSDASHNRSVITFVAPADAMVDAAVAAIRAARDNIDLTRHTGVHPRIGAADVVPFVPLDGATMEDCIAIAREVGRRVGDELGIPVYLYEHAATRASRRNLADVRRGGFEGLSTAITSDPERAPDFGPRQMHATAGAVAIGARPFLVAFNAYIGGAAHVSAARQIARTIRESSGGLPAVKALGLEVDGQAQVSMNLVDMDRTSLATAFDAVKREAHALGLEVTWSEIIGLVPERAVFDVSANTLRLRDDITGHLLERLVLASRTAQPLPEYVTSVGNADPFPGGGSVAAVAGALAAALVSMVAGATIGRKRYAAAEGRMVELRDSVQPLASELQDLALMDAQAYAAVTDAQRATSTEGAASATQYDATRDLAIQSALLHAIDVPLRVARIAAHIAQLALTVASEGNSNAITDAGVAALLASAACTGASYNVRINARGLSNPADGDAALRESIALAGEAEAASASVARLVNAAL